jgi:hypothetical protein
VHRITRSTFVRSAVGAAMFVVRPLRAAAPAEGPKDKETRELLSDHQTVARLKGVAYRQCRGRTALCPDQCGHSGDFATFEVIAYRAYKKAGEYGDPKGKEFTFQVEDNLKNLKVAKALAEQVRGMKEGDYCLLDWRHDYVSRTEPGGGVSKFPERPIVKLEKITREQADKAAKEAPRGPGAK